MDNIYSTPSGWWVKLTDPDTGARREVGPFISFDAADAYSIPADDELDDIERNFYGHEIIDPGQFNARHRVVKHDTFVEPAMCACGWTRWEHHPGQWFEMTDHLMAMSEYDLATFGQVR